MFGDLEYFSLIIRVNKKQSPIAFVNSKGINASPFWLKQFGVKRWIANVCSKKIFRFCPFFTNLMFGEKFF